MKLREYQENIINQILESYKTGNKRPCVVLPCGGGKSIITAEVAKRLTDRKQQVLFLVHRLELCNQITETFTNYGVDMDYCLVGMVQTINKRLNKIPLPSLIITDENHHAKATTYKKIYDYFPDVNCLGVTATPIRLSGEGLEGVNDDLIIGVSAKWLIKNEYLAPYKYYSVALSDFTDLRTVRGEYNKIQLSEILEDNKIYGDTVENYKKLALNKKTIVYCSSVKASRETATEFILNGFKAVSLDGTTDIKKRTQAMEKFRDSKIQILCNCDLFGEGLDVPDVECVILLRKTKSLTLYIQQAMRVMRYQPNKTAIIIDHVKNVYEHGLPDETRMWTLKGKKTAQNSIEIRECPKCYGVMLKGVKECVFCKYDLAEILAKEEKEAKEKRVEAELQEITEKTIEKYKTAIYGDYENCKDFEDLRLFAKAKEYKVGWALRKALEKGFYIPSKYNYMIHKFIKGA